MTTVKITERQEILCISYSKTQWMHDCW